MLSSPVTATLNSALQDNTTFPQSYHRRALISNHCSKYLKTPVYERIRQGAVSKAQELTDDRGVLMRAQNIRDKFTALNSLFADIHTRISHQKPMTENGSDEEEKCIQRYMYFRQQFPSVHIIPKQNLLEAHSVPFVRRWGFGLTLHGEQGGQGNAHNCSCLEEKGMGTEVSTAKTSSPDDETPHNCVSAVPWLDSSEREKKVRPAASSKQDSLFAPFVLI